MAITVVPLRSAEAGTLLDTENPSPVVPAIAASGTADVAGTLAGLIGAQAILALPDGALMANLSILGAWITNKATGAYVVRFGAGTGGAAGGAQALVIQALQ